LAAYGAVLSTAIAIYEVYKGRQRLVVSANKGFYFDNEGKSSEPAIIITGKNFGPGMLYLSGYGFLLDDKSKMHIPVPYPKNALPVELEKGNSVSVVFSCRRFREEPDMDKVVAVYFQDRLGRKWKHRIKNKEKETWLNSEGDGWRID
jgi:hypothetical protein